MGWDNCCLAPSLLGFCGGKGVQGSIHAEVMAETRMRSANVLDFKKLLQLSSRYSVLFMRHARADRDEAKHAARRRASHTDTAKAYHRTGEVTIIA